MDAATLGSMVAARPMFTAGSVTDCLRDYAALVRSVAGSTVTAKASNRGFARTNR
jgi:hypothetical protein